MRSVSKRQKLHDPQAVCSVTSFTARPLLRVGGKDKGTRFLSFVDSMLGFRHLLTDEDLGKAASLCTSMRGQLRSKFMVLSDDKPLPPPPLGRGKRRLSGDQESTHVQPPKNPRSGPSQKPELSRSQPQSSHVQHPRVPQPGTSQNFETSESQFQPVKSKRSRSKKTLPEGVTPIPKRTTPSRVAKSKTSGANQPTPDETNCDMLSGSDTGSGTEDEDAASDKTIVDVSDWVSCSRVLSMSVMTNLLIPCSTIPSLLITDFNNLYLSIVGRSMANKRLIISL